MVRVKGAYEQRWAAIGEMVTWTGQEIGRFIAPGKIRFTGSLFFSTSSTGKLAFLKSLSSPYLR